MAYVDQSKKAKIAAALKPVIPAGWKYSLAVRHHSTIVLTISAAPINLLQALAPSVFRNPSTITHATVHRSQVSKEFADEYVAGVFDGIADALNTDNHDRSDSQTDYFDVGHYVEIGIGRWNKPFHVTAS